MKTKDLADQVTKSVTFKRLSYIVVTIYGLNLRISIGIAYAIGYGMTITLEIDKAENLDEHELKLTLLDSFYEFVAHRGPSAEAYVNKRYPEDDNQIYVNERRKEKINQVNRRIIIANALHKASFDVKIS